MDLNMTDYLDIFPPLIGTIVDLSKVPDPVFAEKMVGEGLAIIPESVFIYAPFEGVVESIHRSKHAITIKANNGVSLLIHIGLDTVNLNGEGFNLFVKNGDTVKCKDVLGSFNIDTIILADKSVISPVILPDLDYNKFSLTILLADKSKILNCDKPIMRIDSINKSTISDSELSQGNLIKSEPVKINYLNGIHARPAALLSSKANQLSEKFDILIEKNGVVVSLKNMMALLGLAIGHNDIVFVYSKTKEINQEITAYICSLMDKISIEENK